MNKMNLAVDPETVLPGVEKMIYRLAWNCANTYPISFEEAKSEAYYAFMGACRDYNPEKGGKFSSWCYFWVWTKLKDLVMKRSKDPLAFVELDEELVGEAPDHSEALEMIEDLTSDLSEDAKEIVSLLMETPKDVMQGSTVTTAKQLFRKVKTYLLAQGKSKEALAEAEMEITSRLRMAWA